MESLGCVSPVRRGQLRKGLAGSQISAKGTLSVYNCERIESNVVIVKSRNKEKVSTESVKEDRWWDPDRGELMLSTNFS